MDTLGERLRYAMHKAGLSQVELAAKANVEQQYISSIITGKSQRPRRLGKLADILNVSEKWLQYGDEKKDYLTLTDLKRVIGELNQLKSSVEKIKSELEYFIQKNK